jgi:hypothetical protein
LQLSGLALEYGGAFCLLPRFSKLDFKGSDALSSTIECLLLI